MIKNPAARTIRNAVLVAMPSEPRSSHEPYEQTLRAAGEAVKTLSRVPIGWSFRIVTKTKVLQKNNS
jgi:hypothetical protein